MVMLKAAYEEIKKVDPKISVVGFCSTGDLGGVLGEYLESCFKLGGLKYADIVSFHPYNAPNLSGAQPADRQIHDVKGLVIKYGGSQPVWNTELYYLVGKGTNYIEKGEYAPGDAAQRFLTDLGESIGQSSCVPGETVFRNPWSPHNPIAIALALVYPNSNFVAYNALARFFEGGKPFGKIRWNSDSVCYIYQQKEGKYIAAFWNFGGSAGLKVALKMTDAEATLYDVYGNKVPLDKNSPLLLTATPYYLQWQGTDGQAFVERLKNAAVETDKPVAVGEMVRLVPSGSGWAVVAALRNSTSEKLSVKVGVQGENMVGRNIIDCQMAAGQESNVTIPVDLKGGTEPNSAVVKLVAKGKMHNFPVKVLPRGKSYRIGTGSGKSEPVATYPKGKEAAHQASFTAICNGDSLLLEITVKDATPSGASGERKPWEQDCIELFFDVAPTQLSGKHPLAYHDRMGRIFLMPYGREGGQAVFQAKGLPGLNAENVRYTVTLSAEGYQAKVAIPLAALGIDKATGGLLGFDIAVDNALGEAKTSQQVMWNSGGEAYRNRCELGFL